MCLDNIRRANNGVTLEWAPDGRHLLTATLAPRLRVDNAFYVYRHDGTLIAQQRGEELLEALWLPAPAGALCFLLLAGLMFSMSARHQIALIPVLQLCVAEWTEDVIGK